MEFHEWYQTESGGCPAMVEVWDAAQRGAKLRHDGLLAAVRAFIEADDVLDCMDEAIDNPDHHHKAYIDSCHAKSVMRSYLL